MVIHNADLMSEDFVEELYVHDSHKQGISKRRVREMMSVGTDLNTKSHRKTKKNFRVSIRKQSDWDDSQD